MAELLGYLIKHEDEILALVFAQDGDTALMIYLNNDDRVNPEMAEEEDERLNLQQRANRTYVEEIEFPIYQQSFDE
jgi:hypothetical protein